MLFPILIVSINDDAAQGINITVETKTPVTDVKGYFRIRNPLLDKKN